MVRCVLRAPIAFVTQRAQRITKNTKFKSQTILNMKLKCLLVLPALIFLSCNNAKKEKPTTEKLIGEWNNLSMRIEINSKNNLDTNETFEVPMLQWEEKLKIKPIRTFFRADSTWNSAHYTLKDSLFYDPSGKWWMEGDKLVMAQRLPSADTTTYSLKLVNDTASFEGLIDWDSDGKKDDKYFGQQIKVSSK